MRATDMGYDFSARTRFHKLFDGIVMDVSKLPEWLSVGDRTGTEHIRSEDTLDVDYNLLLVRAGL